MNVGKFRKIIEGAVFGLSLCLYANITVAEEQSDSSIKAKAERVADKTAAAINKGAENTEHGLTVAAEHTKKALGTAADKTQEALKKAGEKIESVVDGK